MGEYVKMMKPVANCLDKLQSEKDAYMGILLPNLQRMKDQLEGLQRDDSIK